MLGSTLIPSALHVSIAAFAGLCLLFPQRWVDDHLPEDNAPLVVDWWWMAAGLATLRLLSVASGAALLWWLLKAFYMKLLPAVGIEWLGALEAIHTIDLPGQLARAVTGQAD